MSVRFHPERIFGAGLLAFLVACGGGDRPADRSADPSAAGSPDASSTPGGGTVAANPAGEAVYNSNCVTCHMADGRGLPGAFPSLAGSEWVTQAVTAADVARVREATANRTTPWTAGELQARLP